MTTNEELTQLPGERTSGPLTPDDIIRWFILKQPHRALSPREREIAAMLDLKNREIARRLGTTEKTINTQIQHIRAKLGLKNRAEIARHVRSEEKP